MARLVDVGISIRAIDRTRTAINSVRRGFRLLRGDFASLRSPRMRGMTSSLRDIRKQVASTAGVTRGWMSTMVRGSQVVANQTMPRIGRAIKKTSTEAVKSTDKIRMGFRGMNMTMSSSLLSMGLFSTSVFQLGKRMVNSTLEMDKYIRGFKVLDGDMKAAKITMDEIIEVSKLPGIQIPQASEGYMQMRSVGITNRQSIVFLEEFSNAVAIAGGRAIDLRESIRQLGQIMSIQKFDMENWRVMLERIPTIRTAVQKSFGPRAIHTEELNKILSSEGMDVTQAWEKIIKNMMMQERADPDTITNAVERLQNTLWHMSANIGDVYAPTIQKLLKFLNNLAEGFNELSKPMREFIAFMGTGAGVATGMGLALYGITKLIGGLMNVFGGMRSMYMGFMDAPIMGEGGFLGKRYAGAYGAAPDITRHQLLREYRRSKGVRAGIARRGGLRGIFRGLGASATNVFKDEGGFINLGGFSLGEFGEEKRQAKTQADIEYRGAKNIFDNIRTGGRDMLRQQERNIRHVAMIEHRENIRWSQEEERIRQSLADPETGKVPEGLHVERKDILRRLDADRNLRAKVASELHLFDKEMDENIARREKNLDKSRKDLQVAKSQGVLDTKKLETVRKRIETAKGTQAAIQAEMQVARRISKLHPDSFPSTVQAMFDEGLIKKAHVDKSGKTYFITRDDQRFYARNMQEFLQHRQRYVDGLEKQIEAERSKLKNVKLPEVEIIENNIKEMETQLEQYKRQKDKARRTMLEGHQETLRDVEHREMMVDQELSQTTRRGPRGTQFWDASTEADVQQLVDTERRRSGKMFKEATDNVKRTETLRAKALANWKAINHFGVLTEVGYGLAISGALIGLGAAVTSIVAHFEQLKDVTNRFDKRMNENLPTVVRWTQQYDNWRKALWSLRGEYEVLTPQMEIAFKSELKFLEDLSRSDIGITDKQTERMRELNKILKEGKIALDEYGIAFYENLVLTGASELKKHQYVQEAYSEFGSDLLLLNQQLSKMNASRFTQYFGDLGIEAMIEMRKRQRKEMDEVLKDHDVTTVNLNGVETEIQKPGGLEMIIGRFFRRRAHEQELMKYMADLSTEGVTQSEMMSRISIRDAQRILDILVDISLEQEKQAEFTKSYQRIREYGPEALAKIPAFEFTDIEKYGFAISDARQQLDKLRETLLTLSTPMQDFQKSTMQYYESIISVEDKAVQEVDKLSEKYTKAYAKLDVEKFINKNRKLLEDAALKGPETGIMEAIGFKLTGDETTEFLDEFNKLVEAAGGDRQIKQVLDRVTSATQRLRQTEVDEILRQVHDAQSKSSKEIDKLQLDRLRDLQRQSQDLQLGERATGSGILQASMMQGYINLLTNQLATESDQLKADELQRHIKTANSEYEKLLQELEVRTERFSQIQRLQEGKDINLFGLSPERMLEVAKAMTVANSQVSKDWQAMRKMFIDIQEVSPLSDEKLELTGQALKDVRDAIKNLTDETMRWLHNIGSVEARVSDLRVELINADKSMRSLIQDEISFIQSLDAPDTTAFGKTLKEYKDVNSELQKLMGIRGDRSGFELIQKELEHFIENVELLNNFPAVKQGFTDTLKTLKDNLKEIDEDKIFKLQSKLRDLKDELNEKFMGENKEKVLGYLTALKIRLMDLDTGVPAEVRLKNLNEELERQNRITGGTNEQRVSRRHALKAEIKEAEIQVKRYTEMENLLKEYLPLLGDEVDKLNLSAEAMERLNKLQKDAVDNYRELEKAKRKDAIQSILENEVAKERERTEKSRAIERVRRVGVRSINNRFLSPAQREDQFISGSYGGGSLESGITSSQLRSFMDAGQRAINELDMLEHYYRQYYRSDDAGASAFRDRTAKRILEERGEKVTPQNLRKLTDALDKLREDAGNEVIREIYDRRESIRSSMQEAGSIGRVFINDLYESMTDQASKLYDQTYNALWGVLIDGPRNDKRAEEDRQIRKKRQIQDIHELRSEREISARDARDRIEQIEKDYQKASLRLEEDTLLKRERMWEDFFQSLIKGFTDVVAETVKARAGITAGNWISDIMGLNQLPGSRQTINPQTGFWGDIGSSLAKSQVSKLVEGNLGPVWNQLFGEAGAATTKGMTGTMTNPLILPETAGKAAGKGVSLSSVGPAAGWLAIIHNGLDAISQWADQGGLGALPSDLKRLVTLSFDNPANDRAARNTGFKRANRLAKMLGMKTPKDLVSNYDTGVYEGWANMSNGSPGSQSSNTDNQNIVNAIDTQTNAIVQAIMKYGGTNIGEAEVRKIVREVRSTQRQHKTPNI